LRGRVAHLAQDVSPAAGKSLPGVGVMNPMRPKHLAADAAGAAYTVPVRVLIAHVRTDGLAPADWVTLVRGTIAVAVAALVVRSTDGWRGARG
jgi:hypothetical protein